MQIFFAILGFLCLLVTLLVGAVLFFVYRFRRSLQELSQMQDGAVPTPARLHLVPVEVLAWRDPAGAQRLAGPLPELGFVEAGRYHAREVPGLLFDAYAHVTEGAYALVYEHPTAGVWMDLYSRYLDGTSITFTTAPHGHELSSL